MEKLRVCHKPKIVRNISSDLRREAGDTTADSTEDLQPNSSSFAQEAELPNEALQHSINSKRSTVDLPEEFETSFRVHLGAQIDSDEAPFSSGDSSDNDDFFSTDHSKSIWKKWL